MQQEGINFHLNAYRQHGQTTDAVKYLIRTYGLNHENLAAVTFRDELSHNSLLLTADGAPSQKQTVRVPRNLLDFDLGLVLNLLAHEMLHVRQKASGNTVSDKNEREWQAYYEMLFHQNFPNVPDAPDFNRKQFAEKALEYYRRMGENSELQQKYANQKKQVEEIFKSLSPESLTTR